MDSYTSKLKDHNSKLPFVAVAVALFVAYLPDLGRGFIKDDFVWIATSNLSSVDDVRRLLDAPTGFFRPVVSLSFAVNDWMCGLSSLCYGLTNLLLVLGCGIAVWSLAGALGLGKGGGLFAAALWAFNFHGINMAVMWISGRTALLVTLFAVLAAAELVRGHRWSAALLMLLAMLSKEEAVMLPFILAGWWLVARRDGEPSNWLRRPSITVVTLVLPLMTYLLARAGSGAFTPTTAPSFYRYSFEPSVIFGNVLSYSDRTVTFTAVVLLLMVVVGRPRGVELHVFERRNIAFGVWWVLCAFVPTILLPVRSSLYVCFPSVGVALAGATIAAGAWRTLSSAARWRWRPGFCYRLCCGRFITRATDA